TFSFDCVCVCACENNNRLTDWCRGGADVDRTTNERRVDRPSDWRRGGADVDRTTGERHVDRSSDQVQPPGGKQAAGLPTLLACS
ncbi:Hypothetical protein SMAX5B_014276, partial [Scophthalmus maximus]